MEQAEAVWGGTHIGNRQDEEHNILLYQIEGFYVEAYVHREYGVSLNRLNNLWQDHYGSHPAYNSFSNYLFSI
jgi:hypothetical protein